MSTATEVRIKSDIAARRIVPWLTHFNQTVAAMYSEFVKQATRRRRNSKGWRRHVRRMKQQRRG